MRKSTTCLMILTVSLSGCSVAEEDSGVPIRFRDASEPAGVADPAVNSTGPAFADYDNDGDIDIYVPGESIDSGIDNRLWENNGDGTFTDVGAARGVDNADSLSRGASWGDFDNDGDADLAVANMPPGRGPGPHVPTSVYKNLLSETGQPNFENVTRSAGIMRNGNAKDQEIGGVGDTGAGVAWGDYNNDGWLDLYWKCADYHIDNALFENNGDGTFTDVTESAGAGVVDKVREANSQGSPSWTDIDQDGLIDLLVTNEGDAKVLLHNQGDGTFSNVTRSRRPPSGLAFLNPGNANGACLGDIDNDGDIDFYLPTADQANRMIISKLADEGTVSFEDITATSGTADRGGARGCTMADFDNDGYLDIYVNNGGPSDVLINDVLTQMPVFVQFYIAWEPAYNKLYRNNGNLTFSDITEGSGAEGYGIGSGVGAADVNDDGFADLFYTNRSYYSGGKLVNISQQNWLLLNQGNDNHWLRLALRGSRGNRDGFGARVRLWAGDLAQLREHTSAHGYNSTNDPRLLFGLGSNAKADRIEIAWPGGQVQVLTDVDADQTVVVTEPD